MTTWYLATNLPRPGGPREADGPHPAVNLAEIVRIYGIRHWIEHSYKQVKDELGWADFQVRSDAAIRRHQTLENCAFSFCWDTWFAEPAPPDAPTTTQGAAGERESRNRLPAIATVLTEGDPRHSGLAGPVDRATTLVASLVTRTPTTGPPNPHQRSRRRTRPEPLPPALTNHR